MVNMWDWNVVVSWDDGQNWLADWPTGEQGPLQCGEGGGGQGVGASGKQVMFHGTNPNP